MALRAVGQGRGKSAQNNLFAATIQLTSDLYLSFAKLLINKLANRDQNNLMMICYEDILFIGIDIYGF